MVKYLADDGITGGVILTEDEAREHYEAAHEVAPCVIGEFGRKFTTFPVGEYGRALTCAATTYAPIEEAPGVPGTRGPPCASPILSASESREGVVEGSMDV